MEDQTFNIDGQEYSSDELEQLVKLGRLAREVEEKQNTKLENLMPSFTRTTQELKELREELEDLRESSRREQPQTQTAQPQAQLTPEQKQQVISQLRELGVLTREEADNLIEEKARNIASNMFAGRDMLTSTERAIKQAQKSWGIETSTKDLLEYMNETGIQDPNIAIKLKYESDIDRVKEQKFKESRGPVLGSGSGSNTAARDPQYDMDFSTQEGKQKANKAVEEILAGVGA